MRAKTKVSVTVESGLLRDVDRVAGAMSRSAVFEQALASWLRHHRKRALDRAIEDYYSSLGRDERAEDEEWARIAEEVVVTGWDESRRR